MSRKCLMTTILLMLALGMASVSARAQTSDTLPVSQGVYRLPYANRTTVLVSRDHTTHGNNNPTQGNLGARNRIDLVGVGDVNNNYTIVAAGNGWIRWISDQNTINCSCVNGTCANNFVWIEHPNGEWSKYSHLAFNSAVAAGRAVGEFVSSGTPLGIEGNVGRACGQHLHFEIAKPVEPYDSTGPGAGFPSDQTDPAGNPGTLPFDSVGGFFADDGEASNPSYNRRNRIPVFCQIGILADGTNVTASSCDGRCATDTSQLVGTIPDDNVFYRQVTNTMGNPNSIFVVAAGGGAAVRAGQSITLFPGFRAEPGSFFSASIDRCDRPGTN